MSNLLEEIERERLLIRDFTPTQRALYFQTIGERRRAEYAQASHERHRQDCADRVWGMSPRDEEMAARASRIRQQDGGWVGRSIVKEFYANRDGETPARVV